jgi:hypothetical protein
MDSRCIFIKAFGVLVILVHLDMLVVEQLRVSFSFKMFFKRGGSGHFGGKEERPTLFFN